MLTDMKWVENSAPLRDDLREQFEEEPPFVTLPFLWASGPKPSDGYGGPAPTDPLMLYVSLPLADDAETIDPCCFALPLEAAIDDVIDGFENPSTHRVEEEEGREVCLKIAARLRALADKLDAAIILPASQ